MKLKKLLSIIMILFISIIGIQAQQEEYKEIKISSSLLLNGGNYILIPAVTGRIIKPISIDIKYDFNTTAYSVVSGTDVSLQSLSGSDTISNFATISDDIFEKTIKYYVFSRDVNVSFAYNNSIIINIPSSKFTLGDSNIIIEITYILKK